ncbi:hypothetical protein V2J09_008132 [Rumex salicifolius]
MMLMIDGPMINRFIEDVDNFRKCADERFHELDAGGDGLLSREDLGRKLSASMGLDHQTSSDLQLHDGKEKNIDDLVFDKFDVDGNGMIDGEEFRPMMTEMLIAMARGIGSMPVVVGVEKDSLLMKAYENELARIDRKLDKVIELNGIQVIKRDRNLKRKKKSMKIFTICGCNSERVIV